MTRLTAALAFVLSVAAGPGRRRAARRGVVLGLSCQQCARRDAGAAAERPARRRHCGPDGRVQDRQAAGHDHGPHREGIFRGGDPRHRDVVRGAEVRGPPMRTSRRQFLKASAAAALFPMPAIAQGAGPKVVVIGGGFAGATAARSLKDGNKAATVTLVEANPTFTACPFSNGVLAGLRTLREQQFGYDKIARRRRHRRHPARDRGRCAGKERHARQRHAAAIRPARDGAGHRPALRRPARLHRDSGGDDAARLEGRRADADPERPDRSRWRTAARW